MDKKTINILIVVITILLGAFSTLKLYERWYEINKSSLSTAKVVVYYKTKCPYCIMTKNLLDRMDIKYQYVDITNDEKMKKKLTTETGQTTVPYIFIDNQLIGGYKQLVEMKNNGALLDIAKKQNAVN